VTRPVLETARLVLRLAEPGEEALNVAYLERNRERHRHAGPTSDAHFTEAFWTQRIPEQLADAEAGRAFRFCLFLRENREAGIIGKISITDIVRGPLQSANLGASVDHSYEGGGYVTEGARAVIDFAFGELNLHRISAGYQPWNERSGRVLARLGFQQEGFAKEYLFLDGAWRDHVLTALVNRAWKPA
jgi:ribosomal-protein-alanine N-acetyltransferase